MQHSHVTRKDLHHYTFIIAQKWIKSTDFHLSVCEECSTWTFILFQSLIRYLIKTTHCTLSLWFSLLIPFVTIHTFSKTRLFSMSVFYIFLLRFYWTLVFVGVDRDIHSAVVVSQNWFHAPGQKTNYLRLYMNVASITNCEHRESVLSPNLLIHPLHQVDWFCSGIMTWNSCFTAWKVSDPMSTAGD